jgi:ubiquitin carboxyl-terminal hydrolase 9/24
LGPQDLVDQHLREAKETPAVQAVMGGTFAQQIICKSVPYRSEKEEDFYQISLDVRGKRTLQESLDFYCQGELMEGDNQYFCEEAGRKARAALPACCLPASWCWD